jgi:hypothetical protein
VKIALLLAALALAASPAFAKSKVKRHCTKADGSEDATAKTKKACAKAGGKWEKVKADATPAK